MFYRIPDEYIVEVKKDITFDLTSCKNISRGFEEEDPFKEADEEYITESIEE
ncbi:MAG: hypothetical protein K5986_03975 [Clostridium sp.]|uniref:hypothetical protein n=1 Tax=Clostridium sp. DSM 8431 TaxID=1761781 RepID=UPI0008F1D619|nr:hypothetical protein [Clostridium sp. DSM 8431]MCR4943609.1 hypothetical protein [Clostridium sp.]SFU47058.1 hypothetical protein SAMN04487886_10358 [Clostridium sp. DSM 8431]